MGQRANTLLTIQQIEAIAGRLRKYRLSPSDAEAIAAALVHAVDGPIPVQTADLSSLMRPRRPAPAKDEQAAERRRDLRRWIEYRFPTFPGESREILVQHHSADLPALKSAVQYRARKASLLWTVTVVDPTHALVTLW